MESPSFDRAIRELQATFDAKFRDFILQIGEIYRVRACASILFAGLLCKGWGARARKGGGGIRLQFKIPASASC